MPRYPLVLVYSVTVAYSEASLRSDVFSAADLLGVLNFNSRTRRGAM
jgi:hypothetical protein